MDNNKMADYLANMMKGANAILKNAEGFISMVESQAPTSENEELKRKLKEQGTTDQIKFAREQMEKARAQMKTVKEEIKKNV